MSRARHRRPAPACRCFLSAWRSEPEFWSALRLLLSAQNDKFTPNALAVPAVCQRTHQGLVVVEQRSLESLALLVALPAQGAVADIIAAAEQEQLHRIAGFLVQGLKSARRQEFTRRDRIGIIEEVER